MRVGGYMSVWRLTLSNDLDASGGGIDRNDSSFWVSGEAWLSGASFESSESFDGALRTSKCIALNGFANFKDFYSQSGARMFVEGTVVDSFGH
jgi:hypothetical protein